MRRRQADMFSDLAKMANGAASALGDLRSEVQTVMTARQERGQAAAGMVLREDFDAALARIEALAGRVAMLEAQLAAQQPKPSKPPAKKTPPGESCRDSAEKGRFSLTNHYLSWVVSRTYTKYCGWLVEPGQQKCHSAVQDEFLPAAGLALCKTSHRKMIR